MAPILKTIFNDSFVPQNSNDTNDTRETTNNMPDIRLIKLILFFKILYLHLVVNQINYIFSIKWPNLLFNNFLVPKKNMLSPILINKAAKTNIAIIAACAYACSCIISKYLFEFTIYSTKLTFKTTLQYRISSNIDKKKNTIVYTINLTMLSFFISDKNVRAR